MKLKTYDDWQLLGYQVRRGEKAITRDEKTGKALFSRQQVDEKNDPGDPDDEFLDENELHGGD